MHGVRAHHTPPHVWNTVTLCAWNLRRAELLFKKSIANNDGGGGAAVTTQATGAWAGGQRGVYYAGVARGVQSMRALVCVVQICGRTRVGRCGCNRSCFRAHAVIQSRARRGVGSTCRASGAAAWKQPSGGQAMRGPRCLLAHALLGSTLGSRGLLGGLPQPCPPANAKQTEAPIGLGRLTGSVRW